MTSHLFQLGVFVVLVAGAVVAAVAVELELREVFQDGVLVSGTFGFSVTSVREDEP
jgi:hypothetical protein